MKNLTVTVNGVAYNVTVEENTNGAAPAAAAISHRLCLHAALPPHGPRPVACADAPAESARRAGRGRARLVDGGARHAA